MNYKLLGVVALLLAGLAGSSVWLSNYQESKKPQRVDLASDAMKKLTDDEQTPKPEKKATKKPGRVVVLNTTRGVIEFVLFEQDCPKTTARIAELVEGGFYNGVHFPRVEDWVIQTESAKKEVEPMGIETADGLIHAKGTVGMARSADVNSNTSVFYITLEPAFHLDFEYTVFGRVIKGMDVAMKIQTGDMIKTATIRPLTDNDVKLLDRVLQIESDRRTQ
ncbi:MAG: peptidylprolyl isomerase [Armatimonadota bacterium]|jgi:peptidyl-prolyl cis-trans isomerase B (cyclophilin B)